MEKINYDKAMEILKDKGKISTIQWRGLSVRITDKNSNSNHLDIRIFRKIKNSLKKINDSGISATYELNQNIETKSQGDKR